MLTKNNINMFLLSCKLNLIKSTSFLHMLRSFTPTKSSFFFIVLILMFFKNKKIILLIHFQNKNTLKTNSYRCHIHPPISNIFLEWKSQIQKRSAALSSFSSQLSAYSLCQWSCLQKERWIEKRDLRSRESGDAVEEKPHIQRKKWAKDETLNLQ